MNNLVVNNNNEYSGFLEKFNFPKSVSKSLTEVLNIIDEGKTLVEMYPDILTEISVSSSGFQDMCVQYEEHFTPHRKLRQAMLEMQNKLEALNTAKDNFFENSRELSELKRDCEFIDNLVTKLKSEDDRTVFSEYDIYLIIKHLEEKISRIAVDNLVQIDNYGTRCLPLEIQQCIIVPLTDILNKKSQEYNKKLRAFKVTEHMIKDALIKVIQQRNLVEKFKKEVKESGWSFEESEVIYYVLYFTAEMEKQLRTIGRIDTGTFGAIRCLPGGIRKKVLRNKEFLENKIGLGIKSSSDFLVEIYRHKLMPEFTGENEIENVNIREFISIEPIKILSKRKSKNHMDLENEEKL